MFNKPLTLAIICVVCVGVLGVAYWLISPLFITKRVEEKLEDIIPTPVEEPIGSETPVLPLPGEEPVPEKEVIETVSSGTFVGLAGHNGEGQATLLKVNGKYYLRLEDDFRVTNGPDLFVHFGSNDRYDSAARLASLKGNEGGQNYEVPTSVDPKKYNEVWIWCRSFAVPFAKAVLQ